MRVWNKTSQKQGEGAVSSFGEQKFNWANKPTQKEREIKAREIY